MVADVLHHAHGAADKVLRRISRQRHQLGISLRCRPELELFAADADGARHPGGPAPLRRGDQRSAGVRRPGLRLQCQHRGLHRPVFRFLHQPASGRHAVERRHRQRAEPVRLLVGLDDQPLPRQLLERRRPHQQHRDRLRHGHRDRDRRRRQRHAPRQRPSQLPAGRRRPRPYPRRRRQRQPVGRQRQRHAERRHRRRCHRPGHGHRHRPRLAGRPQQRHDLRLRACHHRRHHGLADRTRCAHGDAVRQHDGDRCRWPVLRPERPLLGRRFHVRGARQRRQCAHPGDVR